MYPKGCRHLTPIIMKGVAALMTSVTGVVNWLFSEVRSFQSRPPL